MTNNRVCVYLANKNLVDRFMSDYESLVINDDNISYRIFLTRDGMNCFICKTSGHLAANCPSISENDKETDPDDNLSQDTNLTTQSNMETDTTTESRAPHNISQSTTSSIESPNISKRTLSEISSPSRAVHRKMNHNS
ncbi:hypothetical protein HHI36_008740 [Cryptolaemus montrouzieri]|uniref:CCHC-type domain-containing protein n=1 Tax=Cryptolaemus montrouzieri TaxID=559131 RepID=A0ABD2MTV0_9CUCU